MSTIDLLRGQIVGARAYTTHMIDRVDPADWFRMPAEGVSHVAWQVGHLAVAQYRLTIARIRGARPEDAAFITESDLRRFGIKSIPVADPSAYPTTEAIRALFDRVDPQVRVFLGGLDDSTVDEPLVEPHVLAKTRGEVLTWCAMHEMLHAGQIGLLRRLFGAEPLR